MKLLILLMLGSLVCFVKSEQMYCCKHHKCKDYQPFHLYVLALQQPQGVKALHPNCIIPNNAPIWNIHGLWPSNKDREDSPENCGSDTTVFDITQLNNSLIQEMNSYWISFFKRNSDFWRHEWCKHGTCAKDFNNEQAYFQNTINLYKKYNVTKILQEQGITPSDATMYETEKIHMAIKNVIRASPRLRCGFPKQNSEAGQVLCGIYICFNKSLNPIDCPPTKKTKSHCAMCEDKSLCQQCQDKLWYGAHK